MWYYNEFRKGNRKVCKLRGVADMCPIACEAKQQCFQRQEKLQEGRVWDRVMLISSMLKSGQGTRRHNGTVCLAHHLAASEVYRKCQAWQAGGSLGSQQMAAAEGYLTNLNIAREHPRVNVTDCEELLRSIDPHCSFDGGAVAAFSRDLRRHDGNHTIAFWVKVLLAGRELVSPLILIHQLPAAPLDYGGCWLLMTLIRVSCSLFRIADGLSLIARCFLLIAGD